MGVVMVMGRCRLLRRGCLGLVPAEALHAVLNDLIRFLKQCRRVDHFPAEDLLPCYPPFLLRAVQEMFCRFWGARLAVLALWGR